MQLHEMDWWTVAEGREDDESGDDSNDEKEEGEGRQEAKKPKGSGQNTPQGTENEALKTGGTKDNGGEQADEGVDQLRGEREMYAMLCEMFRSGSGPSNGGAVVTGRELARAMPMALEACIRGTLDRLEHNNKVMVDGPNEGLEGVTVHEIVDEPGAVREKEGGKTGKRHAVRQLARGSGHQTAVHGHNCAVEWEQQKRGKNSGREAGGGCAGHGRAPEQGGARGSRAGGARQAGGLSAGGGREASKSGGAGSGGAAPLCDGEAGCAVGTAPVLRTQEFQPRSEPPAECENDGGGVGMSKSGGEGTNSAAAAGQSGGAVVQRGEAEARGGAREPARPAQRKPNAAEREHGGRRVNRQ